jgi:hypothetical protein
MVKTAHGSHTGIELCPGDAGMSGRRIRSRIHNRLIIPLIRPRHNRTEDAPRTEVLEPLPLYKKSFFRTIFLAFSEQP